MRVVEWVEPGLDDKPEFFSLSEADAAAISKAAAAKSDYIYPSDEDAFQDFVVVHWGTVREL